MDIIAQLIGFIGIGANIIIYQQKSRGRLLLWKLISDALWLLHYLFMGAYSAAVVAVIGMMRESVFMNRHKKWAQSPLWLVLFLVIAAGSAVLTWKNAFSLLPAIASMIAVISFWIGKPRLSRVLAFPISLSMLTYDISVGSIAGIGNELFTMTSSVVGILRLDRKKNET